MGEELTLERWAALDLELYNHYENREHDFERGPAGRGYRHLPNYVWPVNPQPRTVDHILQLRRGRLITRFEARVYMGLAEDGWRGYLLDRLRRLLP